MGTSKKSPIARAGAYRASKQNARRNFTKISKDKPPPLHISAYIKNFLVQLGLNEILRGV